VTALAAGFLTCLSLIVAIGAQNAFVLRQGVRREHVVPVVVVCALSDAALISAGIAGLGSVLLSHPAALTATRYAGAAFLLLFGLAAARRAVRPGVLRPAATGPAALGPTLLACLGFTFLNPHVYLDTVVLLGALANQHDGARWVFGAGAVSASVLWFTALGLGARHLAPLFARPTAWRVLDALVALAMVGLAVALLR
jgi:L-lysine exporter family protein LysE/ArgO